MLSDRITFDPNILGEKACIRGMRISASLILNLINNGMTSDEIIAEYPYLEPDDIQTALRYAAPTTESLRGRIIQQPRHDNASV